jgi:hypothetical protein
MSLKTQKNFNTPEEYNAYLYEIQVKEELDKAIAETQKVNEEVD